MGILYHTDELYERNIGQKSLLKCKDGKVIELKTKPTKRPFVQIYWIKRKQSGRNHKWTHYQNKNTDQQGFVDRDVKDDEFSLGVKNVITCYNTKKEEEKFDAGF